MCQEFSSSLPFPLLETKAEENSIDIYFPIFNKFELP